MIQLSTEYFAVLSSRLIFSAIAILFTAMIIMFRRGWDGMAILFLVLTATVVSELMFSTLVRSLPPDIGLSCSYGTAAYPAAAVIVYIFFSRGTMAEKLFTALFLLSAVLFAISGIFAGLYSSGTAAVGVLVGMVTSVMVYTVVVSLVKYYLGRCR